MKSPMCLESYLFVNSYNTVCEPQLGIAQHQQEKQKRKRKLLDLTIMVGQTKDLKNYVNLQIQKWMENF